VPHPNAVRQTLQRRRDEQYKEPPIAIPLPDDKRVKNLTVKTHALKGYDHIKPTTDIKKGEPEESSQQQQRDEKEPQNLNPQPKEGESDE